MNTIKWTTQWGEPIEHDLDGFLPAPNLWERLVARSLAHMTVLALTIGIASTLLGLILSYLLDVPTGSTVVLVQAAAFAVAMAASPGRWSA